MSKKEKTECALADDVQIISAMAAKLGIFIKAHKEIAAGYQKYRKNGGDAIPGIEKHLGIKEQNSTSSVKKKNVAAATEVKAPENVTEAKKGKKKTKK